jgi:hypothetical protein
LKCPGVPRPERLAPSGFRNLLTPCSTPHLLALFHARSALGVPPPELCSSRAAVRRLRRRYPPDVHRRAAPRLRVLPGQELAPKDRKKRRRTGPVGPPSGFCSTRESVTEHDGLGRTRHVALLGFRPSRVLSLAGMERPSPLLPSCGCRALSRGEHTAHFRVSLAGEIGLSPEGDCRPSWGFGPRDVHGRSTGARLGSHLLRCRGASPSPITPSLSRLTSIYRSQP